MNENDFRFSAKPLNVGRNWKNWCTALRTPQIRRRMRPAALVRMPIWIRTVKFSAEAKPRPPTNLRNTITTDVWWWCTRLWDAITIICRRPIFGDWASDLKSPPILPANRTGWSLNNFLKTPVLMFQQSLPPRPITTRTTLIMHNNLLRESHPPLPPSTD